MKVIGITGGIGSGKTTFSSLLSRYGAVHINADEIAKKLLQPGEDGYSPVVEVFGSSILQDNGTIDRKKLADIVFNDPLALAKLESIIHPLVAANIRGLISSIDKKGATAVVVDVPLLQKSGLKQLFDLVIAIQADLSVRKSRFEDTSEALDFELRSDSQPSVEDYASDADLVITNNGSMEELSRKAETTWVELLSA